MVCAIVVEVRRNESAEYYWNQFVYPNSNAKTVFGINMVGLDKTQPKIMNLIDNPQRRLYYIAVEVGH